jgi:hypothetical protein
VCFPEPGWWTVGSCYGLDLVVTEFVFDRGCAFRARSADVAGGGRSHGFEDRVGEL